MDPFLVGECVSLEGKEFHHVRGVVRIEEGEEVALINGKGGYAIGCVEAIERHSCRIRILSCTQKEAPRAKVYMGLSFLRPQHLDFAIEKGTEVGVDTFILFPGDRSERKEESPSMIRRLGALITASTKQSGRCFSPEVRVVRSIREALCLLPSPRLWADLQEGALPLSKRVEHLSLQESVSVLIGPESGWSEAEKTLLSLEGPPVLLHKNVLRAETAAVVAAYTVSARGF
jgi:16S rRNA (uracil1498-N3)-methyltransferase